jgi:hypothetical protein
VRVKKKVKEREKGFDGDEATAGSKASEDNRLGKSDLLRVTGSTTASQLLVTI